RRVIDAIPAGVSVVVEKIESASKVGPLRNAQGAIEAIAQRRHAKTDAESELGILLAKTDSRQPHDNAENDRRYFESHLALHQFRRNLYSRIGNRVTRDPSPFGRGWRGSAG